MIDNDLLEQLPLEQKIEISENVLRKDFTFSEMCEIIDTIKTYIQEKALQRKKAGKPSSDSDKGRTDEKISLSLGISRDTYHKIVDINEAVKHDPEKFFDIPKRIENGMSIDYAYKMIDILKKSEIPTPDLPEGKFECIYIDVPWDYDLKLSGAPPYKTMTLEKMKEEIKIPAHKNCIMFMWATNPKLLDAITLLEHWGFTYKTNIAWVKYKNDKIQQGTGYYVKGSHELLLIATKGNPGVPPENARKPSVVFAERTSKHSEKPQIFKKIINEMYPSKKKIEMFSRGVGAFNDELWSHWGDELT